MSRWYVELLGGSGAALCTNGRASASKSLRDTIPILTVSNAGERKKEEMGRK